jgi:hypothetical protein
MRNLRARTIELMRWLAWLPIGCAAESTPGSTPATLTDSGGADTAIVDTGPAMESGIMTDAPLPDSLPPDMAPAKAVYAHSETVLFKLDPDTKVVTTIGPFDGCGGSVVDLAVDAKSNVFVSAAGIHAVDPKTAKCTLVASGSFAGNALSFIPAGVLDPVKEVLVTLNVSDYYRVDLDKGMSTKLGELPSGFESSGDIVSVKGGGTYVTAYGPGCNDCLLEIDPKNGSLKKNWGPLGANSVYGVAYWAGTVYAFTHYGQLFEVTFGKDTLMSKAIPIPMAPMDLSFWGAGSTTNAPVVPVK